MTGVYWPWWLGASALTTIAVGFTAVSRRPFGVSGLLTRIMNWREERAAEKVHRYLTEEQGAFRAALVAATREKLIDTEAGSDPSDAKPMDLPPPPLPVSYGLTFIVCVFLGGLASSLLHGDLSVKMDLGSSFSRLVGDGTVAIAVLLVGGMMVGFGTRMAGGCTSGHGLSGCARLRPASLVATAAFFGTGVAVSLLLGAL